MSFVIERKILKRYVPENPAEETVLIPEGVRVIGGKIGKEDEHDFEKYTDDDPLFYQAFRGNTVIRNVYIPNSVTELGMKSFEHCRNIKRIHISNGLNAITELSDLELDAVLFDGTMEEFRHVVSPGWCRSCKVIHCIDGDISDYRSVNGFSL